MSELEANAEAPSEAPAAEGTGKVPVGAALNASSSEDGLPSAEGVGKPDSSELPEDLETPSETPAWRGWLLTVIKLSVAGFLLSLILRNPAFEWKKIGSALLSPGSLAILALGFVGISMSGVRWLFLMRAESIHVPFWVAFRLTWIGHFWNMVIPGAVSGDAVKMYYIGQVAPERREEAWSTVIADRVIGLGALVSLAAVASLSRLELLWSDPKLRLIVIAMVSGLGALLISAVVIASGLGREWTWVQALGAKLPERLSGLIERVYGSLRRISRRPGTVLVAFLISFFAHGLSVFNAFLLGRALGEDLIPFTHYAAMFPIALFSNAVPISPGGGIGVGEMVIGLLFESSAASLGAPDAGALSAQGGMIMICYRVVFYALAVFGGLLYVFYRQKEGPNAGSSAASSDSAA